MPIWLEGSFSAGAQSSRSPKTPPEPNQGAPESDESARLSERARNFAYAQTMSARRHNEKISGMSSDAIRLGDLASEKWYAVPPTAMMMNRDLMTFSSTFRGPILFARQAFLTLRRAPIVIGFATGDQELSYVV